MTDGEGELRRDGLTGRWVLLAPGRARRPQTHARAGADAAEAGSTPTVAFDPRCPFCPGNEDQTPPELARTGDGAPGAPGWRVRVFPNLYPVLRPDARPGATGAHEVVTLSPTHDRSFGRLSHDEASEVLGVLRDRVAHHHRAGCAYAQAIVNHGREAGASIAHPHAQVFALDVVPPTVEALLARTAAARHDLVAADLADAREQGLEVLAGGASAWCPHASSTPYELRIAHDTAGARFDEADDTTVSAVAYTTRDALARLYDALGDVSYNVLVRTAPPGRDEPFRWHVEIRPRLTVVAGFEEATGVLVNVVTPDAAATTLRP